MTRKRNPRGRVQTTVRKAARSAGRQAKKVGDRIAHVVAETPSYLLLQRNDRAIRSEIDEQLLSIGKRVRMLHKRAKAADKNAADLPFSRYSSISEHLDRLERLESEYRENRIRLNQVREEMRGKGKGR